MTPFRLLLSLGAAALLGACGVSPDMVRSYVVERQACPAERVNILKREDLRPSTMIMSEPKETPPAIAVDPARVALWKAQRQREAETWDFNDVFEVRACDQHYMVWCNYGDHAHPDCIPAQVHQPLPP